MAALTRLMVMMHHHVWAILLVAVVGIAGLLVGSGIQNRVARVTVSGIGLAALSFVLATGAAIGPLDDWQHQHGSCLLQTLDEMKKGVKK